MRKFIFCFCLLVISAELFGAPLQFNTYKTWRASRWYLIGKIESQSRIRWLGQKETTDISPDARCKGEKKSFPSMKRDSKLDLEIAKSGEWIAVEISPESTEEVFTFDFGLDVAKLCSREVTLRYGFKNEKNRLWPRLFLSPMGGEYSGQNIDFIVRSENDQVDVIAEGMIGLWQASLPNASAAGKKSIIFALCPTARVEWTFPFYRKMGLITFIEQSFQALGGLGTSVKITDAAAGAFYQKNFIFMQGFLLRGQSYYFFHTAEDRVSAPSFGKRELSAFTLGGSGTLNLSTRWVMGSEFHWGFSPSLLTSHPSKQYIIYNLNRIGFRVSKISTFLLEGGIKIYKSSGLKDESVLMGQSGVRIEL